MTVLSTDKNVALFAELFDAFIQADEYLMTPQSLEAASKRVEALYEQIEKTTSHEFVADLDDAVMSMVREYETIAILYGIRIANVISDVSARPADLLRYLEQRRRES